MTAGGNFRSPVHKDLRFGIYEKGFTVEVKFRHIGVSVLRNCFFLCLVKERGGIGKDFRSGTQIIADTAAKLPTVHFGFAAADGEPTGLSTGKLLSVRHINPTRTRIHLPGKAITYTGCARREERRGIGIAFGIDGGKVQYRRLYR